MIYLKATAEVVTLDVQDVVRTSAYGDAKKALDDLAKNNQRAYDYLMTGDPPVLRQGVQGLANLLTDLGPNRADDLLRHLSSQVDFVSWGGAIDTFINAGIESRGCENTGHRDRYDPDEEADSFDSEW